MSHVFSRNVDEIPEANRRSLETLLGQELHQSQRVFIMLFDPACTPSEATRRSAAVGLSEIIERAGRFAEAKGVSEDDVDTAVTEAIEHVRRRAI
jgi:hypothetical protein